MSMCFARDKICSAIRGAGVARVRTRRVERAFRLAFSRITNGFPWKSEERGLDATLKRRSTFHRKAESAFAVRASGRPIGIECRLV
jgi:hypothetical protein